MPRSDLILKNARILTMNDRYPIASLLAIKGDRIIHVGDAGDLASFTGPGTKVIDCEGRTVVPGFNDAHCHVFSFLRKLTSIDISPEAVKSIDEIKAAIKRKADETPSTEWLSGTDYSDFDLIDKRHPTRWEIDEVAPNHPVVLSHRSLHACVLNSRALELAGITNETEEPPGGVILRDLETGEPNGILLDMLGYIREQVMPPISESALEKGMAQASRHYLSRGITSVQDATVVNDYHRWQRYERFRDNNILQPRLYVMPGHEYLQEFIDAGLHFGSGDHRLRVGHVKITPSETADNTIFPEQPEMNDIVSTIHNTGFRVAIHAIRMETIASAIEAIRFALGNEPAADHRHRIEHCSECSPELLAQIKETGICIASQPPFVHYSGERYMATVPEDRFPWLYRFKSMMDAGLTVAGSSDSPIVNDNPLMGMFAAVTRKAATGDILQPEERILPIRALEMYTKNAAFVSCEEATKGTIKEGKLADIVILSDDPTTIDPEAIKDIKTAMTVLNGRVVWER